MLLQYFFAILLDLPTNLQLGSKPIEKISEIFDSDKIILNDIPRVEVDKRLSYSFFLVCVSTSLPFQYRCPCNFSSQAAPNSHTINITSLSYLWNVIPSATSHGISMNYYTFGRKSLLTAMKQARKKVEAKGKSRHTFCEGRYRS